MHESSKNVQACLADMYEPEWYGKNEVDSIVEVRNIFNECVWNTEIAYMHGSVRKNWFPCRSLKTTLSYSGLTDYVCVASH